ncbi:hypothetical protein [Halarchaeum nitratireducens]|uniref:hypothetical protein n=1 Tax=Halarchaeum nitratireducens TaxID=489913 RepID=UPI00166D1519|nr:MULTISPECIES: hypothetical protein [Halarchaeum]MBP2250554.1 hypothetical protein [Halarchaeum solikamskense]
MSTPQGGLIARGPVRVSVPTAFPVAAGTSATASWQRLLCGDGVTVSPSRSDVYAS